MAEKPEKPKPIKEGPLAALIRSFIGMSKEKKK